MAGVKRCGESLAAFCPPGLTTGNVNCRESMSHIKNGWPLAQAASLMGSSKDSE